MSLLRSSLILINVYFISLALLWTSPELLRDPMPPRNGSQAGDIYSMAIIVQEILYRCGPYEALGEMPMVPKGNFELNWKSAMESTSKIVKNAIVSL